MGHTTNEFISTHPDHPDRKNTRNGASSYMQQILVQQTYFAMRLKRLDFLSLHTLFFMKLEVSLTASVLSLTMAF